jgi:hypothetical protein
MTQAELKKVMNAMFAKQYKAIGFDPRDPLCIQPTDEQHALVKERIKAEIKAKGENDPEFREAFYLDMATPYTAADKRHNDVFDPDYFISIEEHNGRIIRMRHATREHLISWALLESDEHNLAYIKSRLDLWDAHPECKKLEELEAAIR